MSDIKTTRVLLTMAARTATVASAKFIDRAQQFCRLYVNVTVASGTGGLTVQLRGYDPVSLEPGNTPAGAFLNGGGTAITATGGYVIELLLTAGSIVGGVHDSVARMLPCTWDVNVGVGDASSYTYSISCEVFPG